MLISTRSPVTRRALLAGPSRIARKVCAALVILTTLASLLLLGISLFLPFETVRNQLIGLYGSDRTSRYFSLAVYSSAMWRLRYGAACLLAVSAVIAGCRVPVARALDAFIGSIVMSIRHARRSRRNFHPATALALGAITLIGLFLRLQFLTQPMRYDESATVLSYASKPLYLGLSIYNAPNNHLFHTLLVHVAMSLAGKAEWAVRLPAFVFGTLMCLLTYALCRRLSESSSGLWAAALVGTSSVLIEYSTNARGYTLICCATLALLIAAYETLRQASPMWFVLFGATAAAGFWTIPIFLIPFGGTVLWMAWHALRRHRRFRRIYLLRGSLALVLAGLVTLVLYLPPLAVNGTGALLRNQWVAPRNLGDFLAGNQAQLALTWTSWNRDLPGWWPVMMAIAFLAGLALNRKLRSMVLCLLSWALFLFAARRFVPFARNWLMFLPLYLMVAATSFGWLGERLGAFRNRQGWAAAGAVVLAVLLSFPVLHQRSVLSSKETGVLTSAPQIADFMASHGITPDQVFRSSTSDLPIQYYWWRRTGTQPDRASVPALEAKGVHTAWFLLNGAYDEKLVQLFAREGLGNARILGEEPFENARLVEVAWQR